jgi:hypothetical protein
LHIFGDYLYFFYEVNFFEYYCINKWVERIYNK